MAVYGDWVDALGERIGAPGAALRLLISLLMAYPMAFFHRKFMYGKYHNLQHILFILCGSYIGYFNYGWQLMHAYVCILIQYVVVWVSRGTLFSVVFAFVFQMGYLLAEYYLTESEKYDIKWTIPHCVLTLRLIGQAFDVYDGHRDFDDLSKDQKQQALKTMPSLLASAAHIFYPGSFMIGPQYPMKRYLDFVEGKFSENGKPFDSIGPAMKRLALGLFYVGIFQIGNIYVNSELLFSSTFKNLNFIMKMLVVGIYGKIVLYKYVSCWIVAEGSCIYSGISYNGKNDKGVIQWTGCENIDIYLFEKSYKFGHMVGSFNKCTNTWVAQNVYKRLKFLGNRQISQTAALVFLAVWHGLHSGYYVCFFMEFLIMNAEKQFESIITKNSALMRWHNSTIGFWINVVILKTFVMCYFGFCMVPFTLLKYRQWGPIYKDLYYSGLLIFGAFPAYAPIIKWLVKDGGSKPPRRTEGGLENGSGPSNTIPQEKASVKSE
ncbi:lysophospholipid acyltransferase 5 [Folsomia candida]|uniref:Lysophospholipid acyltransferase 5 n=1 Tax=Folsomia candida TaxID=158441 RepID=A0A226EIX6_FOLCA|nr:lysophospholipid acyltransferase 5 [Folsomia candida]XP_035705614.1 lysophospholipid acyltransferase 5 [Folsomia candida]OXA57645.1 Lysophospholipid acyltransferase 5 [Folsomia candida]